MIESVDVLGLGNSLVDIIAETDDAYLQAQDMVKGAMTLIDEERAEALYAARVAPRIVSGGSAANTIVGVASFGVSSAYIGKVKADDLGRAFVADLRGAGVAFDTHPADSGPATGRSFIYVTPDGERTMNTFLGASSHLSPPDVDEALVRAARIVYLEGYMWDRPAAKIDKFAQGTFGYVEKPEELGIRVSFVPFTNIARNRDCGTLHLVFESKIT